MTNTTIESFLKDIHTILDKYGAGSNPITPPFVSVWSVTGLVYEITMTSQGNANTKHAMICSTFATETEANTYYVKLMDINWGNYKSNINTPRRIHMSTCNLSEETETPSNHKMSIQSIFIEHLFDCYSHTHPEYRNYIKGLSLVH